MKSAVMGDNTDFPRPSYIANFVMTWKFKSSIRMLKLAPEHTFVTNYELLKPSMLYSVTIISNDQGYVHHDLMVISILAIYVDNNSL